MKTFLVDADRKPLLPLTFSRPVCDLLVGIDTIRDKWEGHLGRDVHAVTPAYLGYEFSIEDENLLINGAAIPSETLLEEIAHLKENEILTYLGRFVAVRASRQEVEKTAAIIEKGERLSFTSFDRQEKTFNDTLMLIEKPSDIFSLNGDILRLDFHRITKNYKTTDVPGDVILRGDQIFVEAGAILHHCVINTEEGPVFIGENAEVMEGCLIRGPFSLGSHSTLKMGAKIYGATSVGQHCKVGGEVNNSIIQDYSNKGHDGFLGNSVLGSWCNLGADTNTSNLKNNYGEVKVWDYAHSDYGPTGKQFHGLIMGDHSKAGINTMFNTGTVVGMSANIFGGGFPEKFIPSFSWGSPDGGFDTFKLDKAIEAASAMMKRRNIGFSKRDETIFKFVMDHDSRFRR